MGRADYFALGDWNALCDNCGRKRKGSTLRLQWNGLWVCPEEWESRQPQDFVRSIPEHPTPPFVRHPADVTVIVCSFNTQTAKVGFGTVGCIKVGFVSPIFDANIR